MSSHTRLSKRMSYLLRHNPGAAGLQLDDAGWVDLDVFVAALQDSTPAHQNLSREHVLEVVRLSDKQRFEVTDGHIRATQGHSIDVDLALTPQEPPAVLWHGTVDRFLDPIRQQGLLPMGRNHVHLSESRATATAVGQRRGAPVLLQVDAAGMQRDGIVFYCSTNGVWLTSHVAPQYISLPGDATLPPSSTS